MNLKEMAAWQALSLVRDGMVLGLGSGSTMAYFTTMLGERLRDRSLEAVRAVPTSEQTATLARQVGVPLTSLTECGRCDLTVDGADEVDPQLNLIKGWGRALLREKIVAVHSDAVVIVVEESKLVDRLATTGPVPLEIVTFEAAAHVRWLSTVGSRAELWRDEDGQPFVTDNGNYLARCWFQDGITDLAATARLFADRPGILEHGLFVGLADTVVVSSPAGVNMMERAP